METGFVYKMRDIWAMRRVSGRWSPKCGSLPRERESPAWCGRLGRQVQCRWRLGCTRWVCTLVQPGEYDWIVRVRWRCGLTSNYFDHFFNKIPPDRLRHSVRSTWPHL